MPLGCGLNVCKWILGFFNFLIFLCGAAVLGVGIWLKVDKKSILTILRTSESISRDPNIQNFNTTAFLDQAAWILIAAGTIIFLLGFLGCCGAFQESKCMLATYAVFLSIFLILEIGAGIYAAVAKSKFEKNLRSVLVQSLDSYKTNKDAFTTAWDYTFAEMECCGVNNYRDLEGSEWFKNREGPETSMLFPPSCCVLRDKTKFLPDNPSCPASPNGADQRKANTGCYEKVEDWIKNHMTIIIGVTVGIGLIQIFAVIFACCLCCALNEK